MNIGGEEVWQIAAGDTNRSYADLCLRWGVVLFGPGYQGRWPDCEEPLRNDKWTPRKIGMIRKYHEDINCGDIVVLRLGTNEVYGVGRVEGPVAWYDDFGDIDGWDIQLVRRVRWCWKAPNTQNPRLLVILGAGSSIPYGMPSAGEVDKLMKRWSKEWTPGPSVKSKGNVFKALWKASERYYGSNHYGIRPNYERVLGEMTELASWLSPHPFGNPVIEVIRDGRLVSELEWLHNPSEEYTARKLILSQQTFLLEKLADYMRELNKKIDPQSSAFSDYVDFFRRLRDCFDMGVYNLNYDTVARTAWPEAYCGFDDHGTFDPSSVNQRHEWGFIYHLHGSVHHCITGHPHRIKWKDDLGCEFQDRLELAPDMAQDFRSVPLTTLIAGGFKLDQLLAEPYQTFYSALVRHAQEADALLIAGYGFGDLHVNRALRNRFEKDNGEVSAPQVVILEKSPHNKPQTASLQSHKFWAYQLTRTLNTRFKITKAHLNRQLTVASLIERGEFETDNNRAAIWHGGFCKSFSAFNKIAEWLSRKH